jgi:hypothetical protein
MKLEDKIQCLDEILEAVVMQTETSDRQSKDHLLAYKDRVVALQKTITSLRNRKVLIYKNMMNRGDNE